MASLPTLIATAASTVAAALGVVLIGAGTATQLTDGGRRSLRGIGHITAMVTLPPLLFVRLGQQFTWDLLAHSYWALLAAALHVALGTAVAKAGARFGLVPQGFGPVATLGCLGPNAFAYPLSLLQALRGVQWLTGTEAVRRESIALAETLMFTYNLISGTAVWSLGNREILVAATRAEAMGDDADPAARPFKAQLWAAYKEWVAPALSPPIIASLLGIVFGLVPPLRWLLTDCPPLQPLVRGAALIGDGCVPLTMLVLGATLMSAAATAATPAPPPQEEPDDTALLEDSAQERTPLVGPSASPTPQFTVVRPSSALPTHPGYRDPRTLSPGAGHFPSTPERAHLTTPSARADTPAASAPASAIPTSSLHVGGGSLDAGLPPLDLPPPMLFDGTDGGAPFSVGLPDVRDEDPWARPPLGHSLETGSGLPSRLMTPLSAAKAVAARVVGSVRRSAPAASDADSMQGDPSPATSVEPSAQPPAPITSPAPRVSPPHRAVSFDPDMVLRAEAQEQKGVAYNAGAVLMADPPRPAQELAFEAADGLVPIELRPPPALLAEDEDRREAEREAALVLWSGRPLLPVPLPRPEWALAAATFVRRVAALPREWGPQTQFTLFVTAVKVGLLPLVFFALCAPVALALPAAPGKGPDHSRVLLLVVMLEAMSPSAVNGSVICTLHGYRAGEHAAMLAVQYAFSIVSSVVWLVATLCVL